MLSELKSYIPGEIWPAFANPYGAQILAYMYQLEKSQYLPPAELLEKQFLQINEIIRRSIRRVPYYKETLISAGFRKNQEVTPDLWHQVPVLTRNSVQKYQQKLLNSKIPSNHEPTNTIRTSGSTGTAIEVTTTKITNFLYRAFSLREHFWHKLYFPGKIAIIRYADKGKADYPGTQLSHWGITTAGIVNTGPAVMLRSSTDIALQAKFLLREEPDYFLNYPSNIEALAQYFIRKGLRLQKLRAIRTMGEVVGSKVRSLCQEAWGVPIIDMYTAQEAGYIALQCPDNEGNYHIQAENLYVEVVDDEGRPCQPGEIGRVLLTTLHNFAMPLIRYEIGDYAQVGEPCACGRGLPVLTRPGQLLFSPLLPV